MNEFSFPRDEITRIKQKGKNNLIESDHPSLKRMIDPCRGFQTLRTAKVTLKGVEVHHMIKRGYYRGSKQGISAEIDFKISLFGIAA